MVYKRTHFQSERKYSYFCFISRAKNRRIFEKKNGAGGLPSLHLMGQEAEYRHKKEERLGKNPAPLQCQNRIVS